MVLVVSSHYLDVVGFLLAVVVEHVALGGLGDEENGLEGDLTLSVEMGTGHGSGVILFNKKMSITILTRAS